MDVKTVLASAALMSFIIFAAYLSLNPTQEPVAGDSSLEGSYWMCANTVCTRYLTEEEWVQKNCYIQDDTEVCVVRTTQANYVIPKNIVNVSSMRECAEVTCTQEVLVKDAEYKIR